MSEVLDPEKYEFAPFSIGSRVVKINSVNGDTHQDGAKATVVHVMGKDPQSGEWGFFVEWDDIPGVPVLIAGSRIKDV